MSKNKHILCCLAAVLLILGACKTKLTQFTIDYTSPLEAHAGAANLISFSTESMKTDCRVKFERNDTKRSKVKRIHLKRLVFSCDSQKSEMYLVKKLKNIYISSPNYAEQKISFRKLNPENTGSSLIVELSGSDQELINFIRQDRFAMRFEFEKTPDFPEYIQLYAHIELFVEGELIKTNLYHKILV